MEHRLDAILAAGTELLIDSADRLGGVTTVGVDEHVAAYPSRRQVRYRRHRPDPDKDQDGSVEVVGGRGPLGEAFKSA